MSRKQQQIWGDARISFDEAVDILIQNMEANAYKYDVWVFAWSGGKDSTCLLTLIISLIRSGQLKAPKKIIVLYADTRLELNPLYISAMGIIAQLRSIGIEVRIVCAEMDKRFLVYMLGRGVPPPNNMTFRWCTRQIKLDPMQAEIERLYQDYGKNMLLMTGVRLGESAIRDRRIITSCSRDGGECGQGWYQQNISEKLCDKLAPILHFRVCTVWDWLKLFAPMKRYGSWNTELLAIAYGGEEAEENNARTGCVGCPLVDKDTALDGIVRNFPEWDYLLPIKQLRPLYRKLRQPQYRLRKTGLELKKDGSPVSNPNRMGPLTLDAREMALKEILSIQTEVNVSARERGMPEIDILNEEEASRIRELIELKTFPNKWNGNEPVASQVYTQFFKDGSSQELLF